MSRPIAFANAYLKLLLWGQAIAGLAENAATDTLTQLYLSFHTADPGETGDQTSSEATYVGYARQPVPRDNTAFSITNDVATLLAQIPFPVSTGGATQTLTHIGIGTDASGGGLLMISGPAVPNLVVSAGIQPGVDSGTTWTAQ